MIAVSGTLPGKSAGKAVSGPKFIIISFPLSSQGESARTAGINVDAPFGLWPLENPLRIFCAGHLPVKTEKPGHGQIELTAREDSERRERARRVSSESEEIYADHQGISL